MSLSREEATHALRDIAQTEQRSSTAYGYEMAAPHLMLWGVIWVIGYGAYALGIAWEPLWPVLVVLGSIGSFYIGWRSGQGSKAQATGWRSGATFAAVVLLIAAVLAIFQPLHTAQIAAFFPVLVAFYYALLGIWTNGRRMLFVGVVLLAITMGGFFWMPDYFEALMAIAGGGGMILGGFWLRTV